MGLLGKFERRLTDLFEGGFARLFGGRLPPSELLRAAADAVVGLRDHAGEPAAANLVTVRLNPLDLQALGEPLEPLQREAAARLREAARERGLPLRGRPAVVLLADETVPRGALATQAELVPGPGEAELLDGRGRVVLELTGRCAHVGRDPACELQLDHPDVSRRHAKLEPGETAWSVCDLGSTNGTAVNGRSIGSQPLADGDLVEFGPVRLVYRER